MRMATGIVKSMVFCAAALCALVAGAGAASGPVVDNVRISHEVLGPGESVNISFRLSGQARVTVLIHTPDFQVARTLLDGASCPAGTVGVDWDGLDDSGRRVPDEAYLLSIEAVDDAGAKALYDPTTFSGGENMEVRIDSFKPTAAGYEITYTAPAMGRVCIRCGIKDGPFLAGFLNWEPRAPGTYTFAWDGMDTTGTINVPDQKNFHLLPMGFRLPENAIIVTGGAKDYMAYQAALAPQAGQLPPGVITVRKVASSSVRRRSLGVSRHYLVPRSQSIAPGFKVLGASGSPLAETRKGDVINAAGDLPLVMEVNLEDLESFHTNRYEIVVFVDNARFDEEESADSPYTYILDTTRLTDGMHQITFNLAGMAGQVESYSFTINVNNNGGVAQ